MFEQNWTSFVPKRHSEITPPVRSGVLHRSHHSSLEMLADCCFNCDNSFSPRTPGEDAAAT